MSKSKSQWHCNIGDLVKVDCSTLDGNYKWTGMCTWHDGKVGQPEYAYKFTFVVEDNQEITWTTHDLRIAKAEVISESR